MMSGGPLETCWAFNKLWNNKFYYKLHLVGISTELQYTPATNLLAELQYIKFICIFNIVCIFHKDT